MWNQILIIYFETPETMFLELDLSVIQPDNQDLGQKVIHQKFRLPQKHILNVGVHHKFLP